MGRAFEYRKARKLKRWGSMAKIFTKLGREIAMVVKSGGPDPEGNPRLRVLIQNAKAANMPKENVERAIKKASTKDQEDYKEIVYEGYAPYGIPVLIETATDNPTRTVANIRSYFNRYGGALGTSGCVSYLFERKCIFKLKQAAAAIDLEGLELELIDLGIQEIFMEDDTVIVYGDFESFGPLQKYFEGNGFEIISADFERIPSESKDVSEEQLVEIEKLFAKFDDDEDITNYYHTIK